MKWKYKFRSQPISFNWYEFTTGVTGVLQLDQLVIMAVPMASMVGSARVVLDTGLSSNNICLGKTEHTNQREKIFCPMFFAMCLNKNRTESWYILKIRILLVTFRWQRWDPWRFSLKNNAHSFASVFSKPWLMHASRNVQHHSSQ